MRRRIIAAAGLAALLLTSLLATAGVADDAEWRVYLDRFDTQRFDGNNGSHDWSGPWAELGGESDGPKTGGAVWVWPHSYCSDGLCLKMGGTTDITGIGVVRAADLDGAIDAKLCFEVRRHLLGEESEAFVRVAISPDGGDTWKTLKKYRLDRDDPKPLKAVIDVTDHVGANTLLAFVGDGGWASSYITFDNIELAGLVETDPDDDDVTTTTMTTTTVARPTTVAPTTTMAPTTTTTRPATTTAPDRTTTTTVVAVPTTVEPPQTRIVEPGLNDERFTSKDTMAITAIGRNIDGPSDGDRPGLTRNPIEVMASTVTIAAATVRTYALETFVLALFIAWLSLRGLSHIGSRDELLDGPAD